MGHKLKNEMDRKVSIAATISKGDKIRLEKLIAKKNMEFPVKITFGNYIAKLITDHLEEEEKDQS